MQLGLILFSLKICILIKLFRNNRVVQIVHWKTITTKLEKISNNMDLVEIHVDQLNKILINEKINHIFFYKYGYIPNYIVIDMLG